MQTNTLLNRQRAINKNSSDLALSSINLTERTSKLADNLQNKEGKTWHKSRIRWSDLNGRTIKIFAPYCCQGSWIKIINLLINHHWKTRVRFT